MAKDTGTLTEEEINLLSRIKYLKNKMSNGGVTTEEYDELEEACFDLYEISAFDLR